MEDKKLAVEILRVAGYLSDSPYSFISWILEMANESLDDREKDRVKELKESFLSSIVNWKANNFFKE